jgi:DNA-binding transcriptional regulator GbsR (MarR family)
MQQQLPFEVRDMRHKEKFQVDDMYLNGYAKMVGVYGTAVYISLCRHVDINQKCFPSVEKLAEEHNCSKRQIIRAIKELEKLNLIKKVRMGKKLANRYYLLDKSEWTNSHFIGDSQSLHQVTNSHFHSKDTHIKDTHSKDIATVSVADDINPLIDKFKQVNPSYKRLFSNTTQRKCLERLVKQYGVEKTESMIDVLPKIYGKSYAPVITTPIQLEDKLGALVSYLNKNTNNKIIELKSK